MALGAATEILGSPWGVRLLRWAVIALMAASLAACVATGANRPPNPRLEGGQSRVPGFREVAFGVRSSPDQPQSGGPYCALLAETTAQVQRGLMGRRDLAGYDGMVFRFPEDSSLGFYMQDVPIPLSVAWFDARGGFVSSADMATCPDRDCPTYRPAGPYRFALEVPSGGLGRLAVGPGSVLEVDGACNSS